MTREEAAECIERVRPKKVQMVNGRLQGGFPDHDSEIGKAIDMAIAALQEPERKKGRWEDFGDNNSYRCTACGEIWILNDGTPEENNMNYCPNCGADMRGEEE